MLRVKVVNQLNGRKREEVRALERECCEHDKIRGGVLLTGDEENGERPIFFLCYEEERLVGFAVLYRMGDASAEVCGYIHPEYRRRMTVKKMMAAVHKEVQQQGIQECHYVCDPHPSELLTQLLQEGSCEYESSEYLMEWKYSYLLQKTNAIEVRAAKDQEKDEIARLLAGAFRMPEDEAVRRVCQPEDGACYYGAWRKGVLVGAFALSEGEESVYVFDFAVDADHQRRGIGKALLKELIRIVQEGQLEESDISGKEGRNGEECLPGEESPTGEKSPAGEARLSGQAQQPGEPAAVEFGTNLSSQKKIRLQVGSRNEAAFRFYQKNGFQVISQRNYYRVCWDEE